MNATHNRCRGETMLKKIIPFFIYFFIVNSAVYANTTEFEKTYLDVGYKTVGEALNESEEHFKREIALPIQMPPLSFTHFFGRFSNLEGNKNDHLEITFLHEKSPENQYDIRILPIGHKLEFKEKHIDQTFTLNDGQDAIYSTKAEGFILFAFEKHGWQYILSIDRRIADKVSPEVFVEIANSVQY